MQENRISIQISTQELQMMLNAIQTLNTIIGPRLKALSADDRMTLAKMKDGTLPFVQKGLEYCKTNPQFVPNYIVVGELQIDVDAMTALMQVKQPLDQFRLALDQTIMLCGSDAYLAVLGFYNVVKQAMKMKVPGAEAIYKDMSARFEGQKKKRGSGPDESKKP